ncbi:MAG TPA: dethiobiotin synthase [Solirubrobacteraceae bacterium]|nr:dethiobiotin synthase [Solirubrobacteraceae bacterium]
MRGLFITGTDTGAGKTVLSGCLLAAMRAAGERPVACKPVLTGLEDAAAGAQGSWPADDELLATITGAARTEVSPLRFGPAVSPHLAAQLAGTPIDPPALLARTRATLDGASAAIVEGVGGLLVPLADGYAVRDLAVELALPVIVAARPGLGTINHTLLTLEAGRAAGLDVRAVVLTPWPAQPGVIENSNRETIERLGDVEVATLAGLAGPQTQELERAGATLPWREWLDGRPADQSVG